MNFSGFDNRLFFMTFLFTAIFVLFITGPGIRPVLSQEGIIASCYYEEKTTLKKMWKAREAGDTDEVKKLSLQLKGFVDEKKKWAQSLLEMTEQAIEEAEAQNPSGMSPEEIEAVKEQIRGLEADIRINKRLYDDCKLAYFKANQLDNLEVQRRKKLIADLEKEYKEKIKYIDNNIKYHKDQIPVLEKEYTEQVKAIDRNIKYHEDQIPILQKEYTEQVKAIDRNIKYHEDQIPILQKEYTEQIKSIDKNIKYHEVQIQELGKEYQENLKNLKNDNAWQKKQIASNRDDKKGISDWNRKIQENNKNMKELSSAYSKGEFPLPGHRTKINDHKRAIKKYEEEKKDLAKAYAKEEYPTPGHRTKITSHRKSIKKYEDEKKDLAKAFSKKEYPLPGHRTKIIDHENSIKKYQEEKKMLAEVFAKKEFPLPAHRTKIIDHEKAIEDIKKKKQARRDEFTSEKWMNMKDIRRKIQAAELEIAKLENMIGLKDEKLAKLNEDKRLLNKLLNHEFITELPEEESGFIKAIKWCSNAINEVNKAVSKYKKVKKVIDILRSNDPIKAADTLLKTTTGKGLVETVASKILPDKVYKNKYVQKFLNGEYHNAKDALKDFAEDQIPADIKDKIETLKSLRENPEEFLKSKAYDKVMSVIESNPRLKNTLDSFEKAKRYMENPEIIEQELKESMEKYARDKVENNETVIMLKNKMKEYEERIERIKQENLEKIENYKKNMAAQVVKNLKDTIEDRVGLKDIEKSDFVQDLVKGYKFVNEQ
jgi:DNA repair exonuclease SbcCD ATPase subunit